jgi:hypothetical protein
MLDGPMSPGQTIVALCLLGLAAVFVTGIDAGTVVGLSAFWAWVGGVLLWRRWQLRRVVHAIRRLTRDDRAAVMASIGSDPVRVFLEYELHEHGQPETGGPVERFYVSPVDQREVDSLAYVLLAMAITGATTPLVLDVSGIGRIALWGASGAACVASIWCLSRARWYRQFYEVSAFGIRAQVEGAPPLRTLRWVDGVWIVDRPHLNRLQFLSADRTVGITIPYRVVGFDRLLAVLNRHLSPQAENESSRTAG